MSIRRAAALLLVALLIAFLAFRTQGFPPLFQYVLAPPAPAAPQTQDAAQPTEDGEAEHRQEEEEAVSPLFALLKDLGGQLGDIPNTALAWAASLSAPRTMLSAGENLSKEARLVGLYGAAQILGRPPVLSGRMLYPEELERGAPSAVIDEKLAVDLFRTSDPTGREMRIQQQTFTVVGVMRHARTPGEQEAYSAYVPLGAMEDAGVAGKVLTVSVLPAQGSGARTVISGILSSWQPEGVLHSLLKEQYRAILPLRWLLCALAAVLLSLAFRMAARLSAGMLRGHRRDLETRYPLNLLPKAVLRALLVFLVFALLVFAAFLLFQEIIHPVYVFPEWVPPVLVEWTDIRATFWNNVTASTAPVVLRTPEIMTLAFYRGALTAACVLFFILCLKPLSRLREFVKAAPREAGYGGA